MSACPTRISKGIIRARFDWFSFLACSRPCFPWTRIVQQQAVADRSACHLGYRSEQQISVVVTDLDHSFTNQHFRLPCWFVIYATRVGSCTMRRLHACGMLASHSIGQLDKPCIWFIFNTPTKPASWQVTMLFLLALQATNVHCTASTWEGSTTCCVR